MINRIHSFKLNEEVEVMFDFKRDELFLFIRSQDGQKISREDFLKESACFCIDYQGYSFEVSIVCGDIFKKDLSHTTIYIEAFDIEVDGSVLLSMMNEIKALLG